MLIDLWARENVPEGIYYDITWCGFMGKTPDPQYQRLFDIVVRARDLTKQFIAQRIAAGRPVCGWEADDVCRNYVAQQGYGDYFLHRTGHSIHHAVHGNGANLDNLETKDDRRLLPEQLLLDRAGHLQRRHRRPDGDRRADRRRRERLRRGAGAAEADPVGIKGYSDRNFAPDFCGARRTGHGDA